MNKIQVTTADIQAKAEVIIINSYLVAKVVRAHDTIDMMIERTKQPNTKYNKDTQEREPVLDENGNPTFYYNYDGTEVQTIEERVYPLLKELMAAFGISAPVVGKLSRGWREHGVWRKLHSTCKTPKPIFLT